ncbi:MAG: hypothetical protein II865_06325 [Bacteroidales bacterium]|nr:hypothetical protein [Bacteroidales bacterium]
MKKIFFFSMICLMALAVNAQEFVDLGLPSGTKWKDKNEKELFNYNAAFGEFANSLPTYAQFMELKDNCKWEWMDNGYKVTGPNGNSIYLPVTSVRDCDGEYYESSGGSGSYWSSTSAGLNLSHILIFTKNIRDVSESKRCNWRTVRLVQNK